MRVIVGNMPDFWPKITKIRAKLPFDRHVVVPRNDLPILVPARDDIGVPLRALHVTLFRLPRTQLAPKHLTQIGIDLGAVTGDQAIDDVEITKVSIPGANPNELTFAQLRFDNPRCRIPYDCLPKRCYPLFWARKALDSLRAEAKAALASQAQPNEEKGR